MTKEEYLKQLQRRLKKLPKQDYEDAMEYFTEYFADADEAQQAKLMEELGTPKEAANDLMQNLLEEKSRQPHSHVVWIAILAIYAAPVAIPLLLVFFILLAVMFIVLAAVIISIFSIGFAVFLAAWKLLWLGFGAVLASSGRGAPRLIGAGLLAIGICLLCIVFGVYLCKWTKLLFVKLVQWLTERRKK